MNITEMAQTLSTITTEQWEAILFFSQENLNFCNNIERIVDSQEDKVGDVLKLIGIPPYSKGYKYFKEAILMYSENASIKITDIYIQLAQKYSTTRGAVAAAMNRELNKVESKEMKKIGLKSNVTISNTVATIAKYVKD